MFVLIIDSTFFQCITTTIFRQSHMWQRQQPQNRQRWGDVRRVRGRAREGVRRRACEGDGERAGCTGKVAYQTVWRCWSPRMAPVPPSARPSPPLPAPTCHAPLPLQWPDLAVWTSTTTIITTTIDNNDDHDHCLWQTETIENSKFIRWKKLISVAFFFQPTFCFSIFLYEWYE